MSAAGLAFEIRTLLQDREELPEPGRGTVKTYLKAFRIQTIRGLERRAYSPLP